MKKLLLLLILFLLLYSCATELTIKEIENKIPGLESLSDKNLGNQFISFTKNTEWISSANLNQNSTEIEKIIFYNYKTHSIKKFSFISNLKISDDNFIIFNLVNRDKFLLESFKFQKEKNKLTIRYSRIQDGFLLKEKYYSLKKNVYEIYISSSYRNKFLITYPKSFNNYSLLNFENDDLNQIDINLSCYDNNGYQNSKFVFLGPYDEELIVLGFDDKDQEILSFYDIANDEIKKEIVLNCNKISFGFGIVFAECSPSSDYLYFMALRYYNFLLDLNTFELIELPQRNLKGIERFYPLSWSSDSKYLLLNINKELFILDIEEYRKSNPRIYKLNSEYLWELKREGELKM